METYELQGANHKAFVVVENGTETLLSYGTPIIKKNARGDYNTHDLIAIAVKPDKWIVCLNEKEDKNETH